MTEPHRRNRLATAGLLLGIGGLIVPLLGLAGIVCALIALARSRERGGRGKAIGGLVLGVIAVAWGVGMAILYVNQVHHRALRIQCTEKLRKISMNIILYAQDYHGGLPPDLQILVDQKRISAQDLQCPAHPHGDESYVYLGAKNARNWRHGVSAFVMAYEKPNSHADQHVNVMFGDGSVDLLTEAELDEVLKMAANKTD